MNYSLLDKYNTCDGIGIGVSLYPNGCSRFCEGCQNKQAWNFEAGKLFSSDTLAEIMEAIQPEYCTRFSLVGGDGCDPRNLQTCSAILHAIKDAKPSIDIWLYTGYTLEELEQRQDIADSEILLAADHLVDGPFIQEQRDITLAFRGSRNQRIYDISKYPIVEDVTEQF